MSELHESRLVAGQETQRAADGKGEERRTEAHLKRHLGAPYDPAPQVAAEVVGAEDVAPGGQLKRVAEVLRERILDRGPRRQQRDENDRGDDDDRQRVRPQPEPARRARVRRCDFDLLGGHISEPDLMRGSMIP